MIARGANHRGIALFAALTLIALIGLLIGGALTSLTLAQRSSRLTHVDALLTASAEYGLNAVLSDARARGLADLTLGRSVSFTDVAPPNGDNIDVTVAATRLPAGVVWLVADARVGGAGDVHRRINLVARWRMSGGIPPAGLVARGAVHVGADVSFLPDTAGDPDCRTTAGADVVVAPGVTATGAGVDSTRVSTHASAADSASYYLLAAQRAMLDSAGTVVRVHGDTTIAAGSFDGILLIDGALTISGSFSMTGILIARGPIDGGAGSVSFVGAMLSFALPPAGRFAIDLGHGTVRYSSCIVSRALRRALPLRPVRDRSWAEIF